MSDRQAHHMSAYQQPPVTSGDCLRASLRIPGCKMCCKEYFDQDRAHHLLQAPPEILAPDHRAKLERVIRAAKISADGRWYVEAQYDFSTRKIEECKQLGLGRVYAGVTLGTLPVDIRNYIVSDCNDIDISNSHPTCLLHACRQAGFEAQARWLSEYVEHRDTILSEIQAQYGLKSRAEQKDAVIKVLNGGAAPTPVTPGGRHFLQLMRTEAQALARILMTDPRYAAEATAAKKLKGRATFLHYLMANIELDFLMSIASYLQVHKRTIRCFIYDGLLVECQGTEADTGISPEVLSAAEVHVLAETGCKVSLAAKPMESCYHQQMKDVPRCVVDDDYAAGIFVSLYGRDNLMHVQGNIHLFNKSTGQWENSERSLYTAVHAHKQQLVLRIGKQTHNYGGDANNIRKMLGLIGNYVDVDDDFYLNNLDSSQGKLLFQDGIYDIDADTFTPGFDNKVVFAGRINRKFKRCESSDAKADVMRRIWQEPYTHQQIQDGVPLCERIALARALYGSHQARKMYIMVGDTSTGKGVKAAALEQSCGSFVGTFDVNNFVHNPNSGADAAKQLSWLKKIVDKRIAISSEARESTVLCGVLIKQVISGGDSITLRTNYKDEISVKNRSTMFMMCNDVPKIQPCDDAVQDRQGGVFDMQVRFLEKPNPFRPDFEKPRDEDLKAKLSKPEYMDAFLSTLLDAYQEFKHAGHVIPKSVAAATQEWVAEDSSLECLLQECYDIKLNAQTREPLPDAYVPCDELYGALVLEGVGPEHRKVAMSKAKLGRQLEVLGFKSSVKRINGRSVRVRLGLQPKSGDTDIQYTTSMSEF